MPSGSPEACVLRVLNGIVELGWLHKLATKPHGDRSDGRRVYFEGVW